MSDVTMGNDYCCDEEGTEDGGLAPNAAAAADSAGHGRSHSSATSFLDHRDTLHRWQAAQLPPRAVRRVVLGSRTVTLGSHTELLGTLNCSDYTQN